MKRMAALLLFLGFLLDGASLYLITTSRVWLGIVVHLVAMVVALAGALSLVPTSYRSRKSVFFLLVLAVTLPTPMVGTLFLIGFCNALRLRRISNPEKNYVIGETQMLTQFEVKYEPSEKRESILQTLSGTRAAARRKAVLSLRAMSPKKALPILQKAIQDSDEQVRLQAQAQFNKILANLEKTIKQLEAVVAKNPEPSILVQLAEQYHELVFLETSSAETESIYLNRAIELLTLVTQKEPAHQGAHYLRLKCLVKKGDAAAATAELQQLAAAGFNQKLLETWAAEIAFIQRDWPKLIENLRILDTSGAKPAKLQGPINFWLRPNERYA